MGSQIWNLVANGELRSGLVFLNLSGGGFVKPRWHGLDKLLRQKSFREINVPFIFATAFGLVAYWLGSHATTYAVSR